jgi:Fe-S cluster assembly protein SufD
LLSAGRLALIIESYVSLGDEGVYLTNAVTEVYVAEGARLDHYRLQEESESAFHIGTTEVMQAASSTYNSCAISLGARLARHDLNLKLEGERSESSIDGLYVASEGQHVG